MKFYTEQAAQDLADKKGRAVCAWVPFIAGRPIAGLGEHRWVVDPSGTVKEYKESGGQHSIKRVFRPRPKINQDVKGGIK